MSSRLRISQGWPTVWMPKPKITGPTACPVKKQKECIEKAEAREALYQEQDAELAESTVESDTPSTEIVVA